jgi:hypothetical protein
LSKPRDELTETKLLSLDMIERDPLVEPRIEPIDRHIVQAIGWSIRNGISPPPILVYAVGPRGRKRFLLVDGRNRIAATRSTGGTEIMSVIVDGTLEQAAWAAAGANGRPQQARSPAEVRRAVSLAIRAAPRAEDRRIAEHCQCPRATVRDVRQALAARPTGPAVDSTRPTAVR